MAKGKKIDPESLPYRACVGIVVLNAQGLVWTGHRIAEADIPRFLNVMHERRRIRRRDGARHWSLLRDLGDRELWIERYNVATWLDYVRHNQRRTHDDAQNTRDILALHKGSESPAVRRKIERQTSTLPGQREVSPREMADPMTDTARQS